MGKGFMSGVGRTATSFDREIMKINERNRDKGSIKYPELYQRAINDRIREMDQSIKSMEANKKR